MDLSQSIEARSDQINADDLISGPQTYTIREVIAGKAEAPFDFLLVETDRAYRPSKTMRRVIVAAWRADTKIYAGRRLTLYREPTIQFGGQRVGGIRISHMSDLPNGKAIEVMAQTTRGKRETFKIAPLPDAEKLAETAIACATDLDQLGAWWRQHPAQRAAIEARVAEIKAADPVAPEPEDAA